MKKCIIFDMDGVLTTSSKEHFLAWQKLTQSLGRNLSNDIEPLTRGVSRLKSLEIVLNSVGLQNAFNNSEKIILASKKNEIYLQLISSFSEKNLCNGVIECLEKAINLNFKIALGSASKNAPLLLERLNIEKYFDYIVNPSHIKNTKPAPDIFLKASEVLDIPPYNCIGIEDAPSGIQAINSAKMLSVGISNNSNMLNAAFVVYNQLSELDFTFLLSNLPYTPHI